MLQYYSLISYLFTDVTLLFSVIQRPAHFEPWCYLKSITKTEALYCVNYNVSKECTVVYDGFNSKPTNHFYRVFITITEINECRSSRSVSKEMARAELYQRKYVGYEYHNRGNVSPF